MIGVYKKTTEGETKNLIISSFGLTKLKKSKT